MLTDLIQYIDGIIINNLINCKQHIIDIIPATRFPKQGAATLKLKTK